MVIRINKALIIYSFLLYALTSCDSSKEEMSKLFGLNFPEQYIETYREERWTPIIGDGYKVVVYDVTTRATSKIPLILESYRFKPIEDTLKINEFAACQLQYEIHEGAIMTYEKKDDSIALIWDNKGKKMIYYLSIQ